MNNKSCLFFGLTLLLFLPANINAQSLVLQPDWWQPNGSISTIAEDTANQTVYIGGNFDYLGPSLKNAAQLDTTTGLDFPFPFVNGEVKASYPDGAGGWYIGGSFSKVGDSTRNNIAHISSAGTVTSWNTGTNGIVYAFTLYGNILFVSGDFTTIQGVTRQKIAAINRTTATVTPWTITCNGSIYAMEITGNKLYIGGGFSTVKGQTRKSLALLHVDSATLKPWNPNVDGAICGIYTMRLYNGLLYAGGIFTSVKGITRNNLACIDTATGNPTSWNPAPDDVVRTISCYGQYIYIGGNFLNIGGQSRRFIAAIDTSTGSATSWDAGLTGGYNILSSLVAGNKLLFSGQFYAGIGFQQYALSSADLTTGIVSAMPHSLTAMPSQISTLNIWGTKIFVGGIFTSMGGVARKNFAALNSSTGMQREWSPEINGIVTALTFTTNRLYVSGRFDTLEGQPRKGMGAFDLTTRSVTSFNPSPISSVSYGSVNSTLLHGNRLYAIGDFYNIGGQNRYYLASLDTATGLATAWNPNPNNYVNAITASGSRIYAGGNFNIIGGQVRQAIAVIDTAGTGTVASWNPTAGSAVYTLHLDGNILYAGGAFTAIGGQIREGIAAIDTATGNATAWDAQKLDLTVMAIATSGNNVYFAGTISHWPLHTTTYGAFAATKATGASVTWPYVPGNDVFTLLGGAGRLYMGGSFSDINLESRFGFAAFGATSTLPVELLSFTGRNNGAVNVLNWSTASEQNNDHFIVEHSADAKTFERMTTIKGAGNSKTMMYYKAIDNKPWTPVTYYRLRQVDIDGAEHLSKVISVRNKTEQTENNIVYPNPSNGLLYIDNNEGNISKVEVFDLLGRNIYSQNNMDSNSMLINNNSWNPGVYVIRVYSNNGLSETVKIIKE